jgi:hypothetical protein
MNIPEHLWRFPTTQSISSLSKRFNFPNTQDMQDWEWEVSDPNRIDEFIRAYISGELDDDERFTIMETIIQSFEDIGKPLNKNQQWLNVLSLIDKNLYLHIYTVWYWADEETENIQEQWQVTSYLRKILNENRDKFL